MKKVGFGGRWGAWALSSSVVFQSACLLPRGGTQVGGQEPSAQRPAPDLHIRVASVVAPISTSAQIQTLLAELKSSELSAGAAYLAPEQIVAMAIAELDQGHPWDSALLLGVGTYRYRQQRRLARRLSELDFAVGRSFAARFQSFERQMLTRDMDSEAVVEARKLSRPQDLPGGRRGALASDHRPHAPGGGDQASKDAAALTPTRSPICGLLN